jgi:hypothetical protein
MPTKNPRVNITLDKQHLGMLSTLAARDKKSVSATARDLVLKALELEEDLYFSRLAEKREAETKKWLSHDDVWK